MERARGEVMLEIELLEVDRDKATQLGITPPSSAQAFLISPNDIRALIAGVRSYERAHDSGPTVQRARDFPAFRGSRWWAAEIRPFLLTLPGVSREFFRCADAGAKRPPGSAARAGREAGDIFRRRSLSDHAVVAVGQRGHWHGHRRHVVRLSAHSLIDDVSRDDVRVGNNPVGAGRRGVLRAARCPISRWSIRTTTRSASC